MIHPDEKDLVDAYYGDREPSVELHLAACKECRSLYQNIVETLDAASEFAVPERGPEYGGDVWANLYLKLPFERSTLWSKWWLFTPATAALLTIFFVSILFTRHEKVVPVVTATANRALYLGMSDHLQQAQILLTELAHTDSGMQLEKERARDLITSNRILRQKAMHAGDNVNAAVLDDLERVLLEVANSDSGLEAVRQRVENGSLLFRVRISGSDARIKGEKL